MAIYATVTVFASLPPEIGTAGKVDHMQTYHMAETSAGGVEHFDITPDGRLIADDADEVPFDGRFEFFVTTDCEWAFDCVAMFEKGRLQGIVVEKRYPPEVR